jgi:hypothetical protein
MDMVFAMNVTAEAEVIKAADLEAVREQAAAELAEIKNEETPE